MGIPSYFHSIIRAYGDRFFGSKRRCRRLFLDLNCCIHGCKNRVLESFREDPTDPHHAVRFEEEIIQEVIRTILRFCKETSPTDLLWIAVDGVVPVAKMVQQRERRMRAVEERARVAEIHKMYGKDPPRQWDSNAITPGTPFMLRMCDTIRTNLPRIRRDTGVSSVQMSGVRIPGEGEQKIFEYIRKNPGEDPDSEDVIYGLDADLIILSLLCTRNPFQRSSLSLLREEQAFGRLVRDESTGEDILLRFAVSEFARIIPREWSGKDDLSLLDDYVVLMSLMGNDFVPHSPSLTFRGEGMERILDAYRWVGERVVESTDSSAMSGPPKIRWDILSRILSKLEEGELQTLREDAKKTETIRRRILSGRIPFRHGERDNPVDQDIAAMDWEHLRLPDMIHAGEKGWKDRYYGEIAGCYGESLIHPIASELVNRVCEEYLHSIWWCWSYYNGAAVPGDRCYSFASGPLLGDSARFAREWTPHSFEEESMKVEDIPVEAQLLVVLPQKSHHILPGWVRDIAADCPDLYPVRSNMWYYGKRHAWECTAILPRLPIRRVARLVNLARPET